MSWDTTGKPQGLYMASVVVEALSGGNVVSNAQTSFLIRVTPSTNNPPAFEAPTPADGQSFTANAGSTLQIDLKAADPDSGDSVDILDSGLPQNATLTDTPGNPATGTFTMTPSAAQRGQSFIVAFTAQDSKSPPASDLRSYTIHVRAAPDTSIDSGPANGSRVNNATPSFGFSSSPAGASFECSLVAQGSAPSFGPCSGPGATHTPSPALADGDYTFSVRATDAGNTDSSPASRDFTVDLTPPQTSIDSGPANATTTGDATPTFGVSADDANATFECSLVAQGSAPSFGPCSGPGATHTPSPALADGDYTFSVRAIDRFGNVDQSPADRNLTVDTTGPGTSIDSGPAGTIATGNARFGFSSAAADLAGHECRLDDGPWGSCTSATDLSSLAEGPHTFRVRATDATGNVGATAERSFTYRRPTLGTPEASVATGSAGSVQTGTRVGASGQTFFTVPREAVDGAPGGCLPFTVEIPINGAGGSVTQATLVVTPAGGGAAERHPMADDDGNGTWRVTLPCALQSTFVVEFSARATDGTVTNHRADAGGIELIDPSGNVYDAAAFTAAIAAGASPDEARCASGIEGATVTLQRQTPAGSGIYVDVAANDAGIAPQVNPQRTDSLGHYRWDVAAGSYRVVVTAEGYSGVTSQAVTVPPPVTDLHVALTPDAGTPPPNNPCFTRSGTSRPATPSDCPNPIVDQDDNPFGIAMRGELTGETIDGTDRNDLILGDAGDDVIEGLAGNDCLYGEDGNDLLDGGDGRNFISGGPGTNVATVDDGGSIYQGGGGRDRFRGGAGDDLAFGDPRGGTDGAEGPVDRLLGKGGADRLNGVLGSDRVIGGAGEDRLKGALGSDSVAGSGGADVVRGSRGADKVVGGKGRDKLNGGKSRDLLKSADGRPDSVNCGQGKNDSAVVDARDKVRNCESTTIG